LDQHHVDVDIAPAWVFGDPARLTQVVDNLLTNAMKYTPSGGKIAVRTWSDRDEVVLHISDNGVGIAAEFLPRIFESFTQGPRTIDRAQGGLGLGLTLAQRLVLAHGGRIVAASPGLSLGSTFTVYLPRVEPAVVVAPVDKTSGLAPPRRILVIEDNDDGREALRLQLTIAGHEVHVAANGPDGIRMAANLKPDVVLLDIGLPGLDGYEVARHMRAAGDSARLIGITGYGQPRDRERARNAGIEHYLVKPIDVAELARLLT
jgi:CheY-like chemotaxis protein